jgi:hypothetical protein
MRHFCDELGDNRSAERVEILGNHHKRTHTADDVVNSAMSVNLFLFDVHRPHDTSSDRNYSAADRSYDPVRLPSWPPPVATLRPLPSPLTGLPPITRTTFPACRAHYPGGSTGCSCRLLPRSYSLPQWQEGRHPRCHFRGLLGLHSHYGPPDHQPPRRDLCHEAPAQSVTRPGRSPASRSTDNCLGGIFLHW